nr:MAG: L protein [Niukluk phantom virus]
MDRMMSYRPRAERSQQGQRVNNTNMQVNLSSEDNYQAIIQSNIITVHGDIPAEDAAMTHSVVADARHNMWHAYITDHLTRFWNNRGEVPKFSDFVHNRLGLTNVVVPPELMNKTPDFLHLHRDGTRIFLGDVAVTGDYENTVRRKHEKYKPIRDFLIARRYVVIHQDFILMDNLSNMIQEIKKFETSEIINTNRRSILKLKQYTELANNIMRTCSMRAAPQDLYNNIMRRDEASSSPIQILEIPQEIKDSVDISTMNIDDSVELELMMQIKNKVDSVGSDQFFDTNIKSSINAFDGIKKLNMENPNKIQPKSILKVVDNSKHYTEKTDYELILDYMNDLQISSNSEVSDYILGLFPTHMQVKCMKSIKEAGSSYKTNRKVDMYRMNRTYGKYQYTRTKNSDNRIRMELEVNLEKGKKKPNVKSEPGVINMEDSSVFSSDVEYMIDYYGSISDKKPFLNDDWDYKSSFEKQESKIERDIYRKVLSTNGAQLCHSMGVMYNRITHLSTNLGKMDNIFVPPNGSFISIIPSNHAPVSSRRCDIPLVFVTRSEIGSPLGHIEYEHTCSTNKYIYYVSKLSRLSMEKISCWSDAAYKLIATASYLISLSDRMWPICKKIVGFLTMLSLDVHQKTSEYLDLLKYISFMPFADIHRLPALIKDKCNLLMKTKFDAWHLSRIENFVFTLSDIEKLNAKKPELTTTNTIVRKECLGIEMNLPSFFETNTRHERPDHFIEEIAAIYTIRPKHLYGSQFLDCSVTNLAVWNNEYIDEIDKHGNWATDGFGEGDFPFEAKFCYSSAAIYFAEKEIKSKYCPPQNKIMAEMMNSTYGKFMHDNCSLRGCVKSKETRDNADDIHTTSLDECLNMYRDVGYSSEKCKVVYIALQALVDKLVMEFAMSEKDQRGGGRPISTPNLLTKAMLMLIEKPEAAKGKYIKNNIIVPGRNKLQCQHECYTDAIARGAENGLKKVFQLTEDQSKYSENDNPRKYESYIRSDTVLDANTKILQMAALRRIYDRVHLVHRMPKAITDDPELRKYIIKDAKTLGVRAIIGWPQGMLNYISTSVHSAADLWITKMFQMAYPNDPIYTSGLVHSDDSWVTVCCNSVEVFSKFALFRMYAKKLFCLKMNEKKLWGSKYLGELVSNYNLNGSVHTPISKTISNGMSNLTYQNWPIDVNNQLSTLQQVYRQGANIPTLIMIGTILRQQIMGSYNVKGFQKENIHNLPVDIGGYPNTSVFELSVAGTQTHYSKLLDEYYRNPNSECSRIVRACLLVKKDGSKIGPIRAADDGLLSHISASNVTRTSTEGSGPIFSDDVIVDESLYEFQNIVIPSKGDVFQGIKHIFPKSRKLAKTLNTIREVSKKFSEHATKLPMVITKPLTIEESLGDLSEKTNNAMYRLASEKYTQNIRRLATSQAMRSAGKVVRISEYNINLTFNELYINMLDINEDTLPDLSYLETAFCADNEMVNATGAIVHCYMDRYVKNENKNKVINHMPRIASKYDTISDFKDVLLHIVDKETKTTNYYSMYGTKKTTLSTLNNDCEMIARRFEKYFAYHDVKYACNLLMEQKISVLRNKDFIQPRLDADDLPSFIDDLYGSTISAKVNYKMKSRREYSSVSTYDKNLTQSLYCLDMMNNIYPEHFEVLDINRTIGDLKFNTNIHHAINEIDPAEFEKNDKLKHAILQYRYNKNKQYLDDIITSSDYDQYWDKTQKYDGRSWTGDYELNCKSGKVIARVSCVATNVTLYINTRNLPEILKIMRKVVAVNFPSRTYHYEGFWGLCDVWHYSERAEFHRNQLWLNFNHIYDTTMSKVRARKSIKLNINNNLVWKKASISCKPDAYTFDKTLRVITACVRNAKSKDESTTNNKKTQKKERMRRLLEFYNRDNDERSITDWGRMADEEEYNEIINMDSDEECEDFVEYEDEKNMEDALNPDLISDFKCIRVANVYQNFNIPLRGEINIKYKPIDGINNLSLLEHGIVEDLILSRPMRAGKSVIENILLQSEKGLGFGPVFKAYAEAFDIIKNLDFKLDDFDTDSNYEVIAIEMGEMTTEEFVSISDTTEVESLSVTELKQEYLGYNDNKKVFKVTNLKRELAKQYVGSGSNAKVEGFKALCMTKRSMMDICQDRMRRDIKMLFDDMRNGDEPFGECSLELICFIYGNGLDLGANWNKSIDMNDIMRISNISSQDQSITRLYKEFVKVIKKSIYNIEELEWFPNITKIRERLFEREIDRYNN